MIGVSIELFKYSKLTKNKAEKAAAQNLTSQYALLSYNVPLWYAHVCAGTPVRMDVKMWASVDFFSSFYTLSNSTSLLLRALPGTTQGK